MKFFNTISIDAVVGSLYWPRAAQRLRASAPARFPTKRGMPAVTSGVVAVTGASGFIGSHVTKQ
jgi:hypothetical protein